MVNTGENIKMCRKIIYSMIFVFITVMLLSLITAATSDFSSCKPVFKIINQDPNPAIPDSYVKVVIEISGLDNCNGFGVKLNPEYPFSLDPGINPVQTIESKPYVPDTKNTWDVLYKVRVAQDAVKGDYLLKLKYHTGSSADFEVYSAEAGINVSIVDSQTNFDAVIQDYSGSQMSFGIVNTGENTANSLIVKIPQQDNFRVTGTSEQIVGNLAAGDYTIVSFNVAPARSGARNFNRTAQDNNGTRPTTATIPDNSVLKVQIDYTDEIGKRRSVSKDIQFGSSLIAGNNSTSNFQRNRTSNSTSSFPTYYWYIIIAVVLVILFIIYKKTDKFKNFFKKGHKNKGSSNEPDWVTNERTHKKK